MQGKRKVAYLEYQMIGCFLSLDYCDFYEEIISGIVVLMSQICAWIKSHKLKHSNWVIKAAIYIKLKSFYCIWNEKIRIIGTKVVWQHYQSHLHTQLNHLWRIDFTSRIHYYLDLFHVIMTKMTVVKIGPETNCHQAKWILLEFFFLKKYWKTTIAQTVCLVFGAYLQSWKKTMCLEIPCNTFILYSSDSCFVAVVNVILLVCTI